jgi:dihydroxyacetone kinase
MKKLINRPEAVVEDMLQGLVAMYPHLARLSQHPVLVRADAGQIRDAQVALISGGGSGHEPAHAGYVGAGMLSAAVAGEVFTSPPSAAILAAIEAVAGKPGVLLIVKNYTGDRFNFGLAAEIARTDGIAIETVLVADDVALATTQERGTGRGLAGTVLVHKIAGAAAAAGKTLSEVAAIAHEAAGNVATMGLSLSAGTVPAIGKQSYLLADDEVELGLGIHGEPGVQRTLLKPADDLAKQLLERLLSTYQLAPGERIAVLINNLGGTTNMELAIFARKALDVLRSRAVVVERVYAGAFVTSLEAAGISVSVIRLNDELLRYLDAPTSAPAWPNTLPMQPSQPRDRVIISTVTRNFNRQATRALPNNVLQRAIQAACRALKGAEAQLTELDLVVGDGDLGLSLSRGARSVEGALATYPLDNVFETLKAIGLTLQEVVGGSSGPLYGVLFLRAASALQYAGPDPAAWTHACFAGCEAIAALGGASPGDRTMLDALLPFAHTLQSAFAKGESPAAAAQTAVAAAESAAQATAQMTPRRGRASYLAERAIGHPDPGAIAIAIWLRAVAESILVKMEHKAEPQPSL